MLYTQSILYTVWVWAIAMKSQISVKSLSTNQQLIGMMTTSTYKTVSTNAQLATRQPPLDLMAKERKKFMRTKDFKQNMKQGKSILEGGKRKQPEGGSKSWFLILLNSCTENIMSWAFTSLKRYQDTGALIVI